MPSRYKSTENNKGYFISTTTANWVNELSGYKQGGVVNEGLIQMNKVTAVYEEVSPGTFELLTMYPNK